MADKIILALDYDAVQTLDAIRTIKAAQTIAIAIDAAPLTKRWAVPQQDYRTGRELIHLPLL
jgi:hypothetical protein